MPSASTKPENKAPPEGSDPFKAAVSVVERKVRNLEKRKGKLDQYRLKHEQGEALNEDQKQAIQNYEIVIQNLEFARDLHKQFQDIQADNEKLLKKQLRKEKKEKLEKQAAEVKRVRDLLQLQGLLDNMGSDAVRAHFQTGKHGAVVLTEDNLNQLDEFYTLISPSRDNEENYEEQMNQAAEHITNFLDAKEKEVAGSTYKGLKELVDSIQGCCYFDNYPYKDEDVDVVEEPTEVEPEQPEEAEVEPEPVVEEKTEEVMEAVPEDVPQVPTVEPTPQAPQQTPQEPSPVVEMAEPGANYEDDSFFSTPTYPAGQRAFQEIVSSVQGTFNFLQESQIGSESPHIDPAVVAVQPMNPGLHKSQTDAMHGTTFQSVTMLGADDQLSQPQPPQQQLTQQPQPQQPDSRMGDPAGQTQASQTSSLETTYQTTQDYSQNLMTQGLTPSTAHSYADQSSALGHSHSHSHTTMDQSVVLGQAISATPDIPPTIPLPNQSSLQGVQDQNIIPEGQEKKPFAMNPNAAAFQSMYNPSMPHAQNNGQMTMSSNMHEEKGLNHQNDFQNNGFGGNFGGRSNNGGQRGGSRGSSRGGRGGMSNGFSRGGSRGGGGPYNSGRGGSYNNSRGGSRGAYQGYPPRTDYRPEGYQSYSNGYSNGSSFKRGGGSTGASRGNSMRGGAMRGGPPRGGSDRGRGPSRGGFSTRSNPVQVQQTA